MADVFLYMAYLKPTVVKRKKLSWNVAWKNWITILLYRTDAEKKLFQGTVYFVC